MEIPESLVPPTYGDNISRYACFALGKDNNSLLNLLCSLQYDDAIWAIESLTTVQPSQKNTLKEIYVGRVADLKSKFGSEYFERNLAKPLRNCYPEKVTILTNLKCYLYFLVYKYERDMVISGEDGIDTYPEIGPFNYKKEVVYAKLEHIKPVNLDDVPMVRKILETPANEKEKKLAKFMKKVLAAFKDGAGYVCPQPIALPKPVKAADPKVAEETSTKETEVTKASDVSGSGSGSGSGTASDKGKTVESSSEMVTLFAEMDEVLTDDEYLEDKVGPAVKDQVGHHLKTYLEVEGIADFESDIPEVVIGMINDAKSKFMKATSESDKKKAVEEYNKAVHGFVFDSAHNVFMTSDAWIMEYRRRLAGAERAYRVTYKKPSRVSPVTVPKNSVCPPFGTRDYTGKGSAEDIVLSSDESDSDGEGFKDKNFYEHVEKNINDKVKKMLSIKKVVYTEKDVPEKVVSNFTKEIMNLSEPARFDLSGSKLDIRKCSYTPDGIVSFMEANDLEVDDAKDVMYAAIVVCLVEAGHIEVTNDSDYPEPKNKTEETPRSVSEARLAKLKPLTRTVLVIALHAYSQGQDQKDLSWYDSLVAVRGNFLNQKRLQMLVKMIVSSPIFAEIPKMITLNELISENNVYKYRLKRLSTPSLIKRAYNLAPLDVAKYFDPVAIVEYMNFEEAGLLAQVAAGPLKQYCRGKIDPYVAKSWPKNAVIEDLKPIENAPLCYKTIRKAQAVLEICNFDYGTWYQYKTAAQGATIEDDHFKAYARAIIDRERKKSIAIAEEQLPEPDKKAAETEGHMRLTRSLKKKWSGDY